MTGKIIRPAYKNVSLPRKYVAIADREEDNAEELYVPSEERF